MRSARPVHVIPSISSSNFFSVWVGIALPPGQFSCILVSEVAGLCLIGVVAEPVSRSRLRSAQTSSSTSNASLKGLCGCSAAIARASESSRTRWIRDP